MRSPDYQGTDDMSSPDIQSRSNNGTISTNLAVALGVGLGGGALATLFFISICVYAYYGYQRSRHQLLDSEEQAGQSGCVVFNHQLTIPADEEEEEEEESSIHYISCSEIESGGNRAMSEQTTINIMNQDYLTLYDELHQPRGIAEADSLVLSMSSSIQRRVRCFMRTPKNRKVKMTTRPEGSLRNPAAHKIRHTAPSNKPADDHH